MNTYIPSTEDIYRICFITMRGWKLIDGRWEKEGCKRELTYNEKESNEYCLRNNLKPRYFGVDFLLADAYDYQLSLPSSENILIQHIQYNTGDKIWYIKIDDTMIVVKIITHNGITWRLGDKKLNYGTY